MDHEDDDDVASSTDLGSALGKKVNVGTNEYRGTVTILGKEIYVGQEAAKWAKGGIAQAQTWLTRYGAAWIRDKTTAVATAFKATDHRAAKIGNAAEMIWRYGLPAADVALGVKTAMRDGYKRMSALKDEAAVILAANNDMKVGVGGVLSTNFRALANERALIFKEGKKTVLSSLTSVIQNLPGILINVWQQKVEMIQDPNRVFATLPPGASAAEHARAEQKFKELSALKTAPASDAAGGDPVSGAVGRIFKPKSLADYQKNLEFSKFAPFVGGLLGGALSGNIQKDVGTTVNAWRLIKRLEVTMKEEEPTSGGEIEQSVREIFQQHAKDCGVKQKLAGNKFTHIVEEVSEALVNEGLHPQALVELLDDHKVITLAAGKDVTYGKPIAVKEEIAKLINKYTAKVSQKEFYKDVPFTKEDAVKAFNEITDEERPFYTMLFPPGILEAAGAIKAKVAECRKQGREAFTDELTGMMREIIKAGRDELEKQGVKKELIDELEAIEDDFNNAMRRGRAGEYVSQNLEDTSALVRNMALSAKDKSGFWAEYLQKRAVAKDTEMPTSRREVTPRSLKEQAERDPDAGVGINN